MKQLTLPHLFPLLAIAILIAGCSSEPTAAPTQKTYSAKTQKEFEVIEKNDLPHRNASNGKPTPRPPFTPKEVPHERAKGPLKEALAPVVLSSESNDIRQLNAKNQERLQEINQNLAFFCMKHRKDGVFKDEENCLAYTKKVLSACERKHKLINTVMVNCIKDRLKKRQ